MERDTQNISVNPLLDKYKNLTPLARWKAIILEYGIDVFPKSLFNEYPAIAQYKTKFAEIDPYVANFRYVDNGTDVTVVPSELIITHNGNKSLVKVNFRKNSPLALCFTKNGFIIKEKDNETVLPVIVELVPKKKYSNIKLPKEIDENQHFLQDCVQIVGQDRIGILAFEGCWHWNTNMACQFCDANPKRKDFDTLMPSLNSLAEFGFDEAQWWKKYGENYMKGIEYAFAYVLKNEKIEPHQHLQLMAGNLLHSDYLWEICRQISNRLNKVKSISSFDSYLNIGAPKNNVTDYLKMAKNEMGFRQISFNLEVIGQKRFKEVCPGKSSVIGYDNYVKALEQAVGIFGFGNVRSNFVLGAQPIEELIVGIRDMASKGIVADYSVFAPKHGTPWERKLPPDMQTIVKFTNELVDIYRRYEFHGIYCSLSSRSNILNEVLSGI